MSAASQIAGSPSVVIAVPVYRRRLEPDERVSWRHLRHFLGRFETRVFLPEGLENPLPALAEERFPAHYFESVDSYSRLLLSEAFYRRFEAFDFLLIYQLDALVFSGDLGTWCGSGDDYVGAPWWWDPQRPSLGLSRAGNGGLSLRRVGAFLEVLTSRRYRQEGVSLARQIRSSPLPDLAGAGRRWRPVKRLRVLREARRGVEWYAGHYSLNEDHFWSDRAHLFRPGFRVASLERALRFSFEHQPRLCFELNGRELPFGCHAWARHDRAFWEPFLLGPTPEGS